MGGYHTVVAGQTITAANHNTYIRDQVTGQYANAAARNSAVGATPAEAIYADLADVEALTRSNGAGWDTVASAAAWTNYAGSFALTASTTPPTIGNSTVAANYIQVGKTVYYSGRITIGSTFSAGSGTYRFSLPVTPSTAATSTGHGIMWINDSGTAFAVYAVQIATTTYFQTYGHAATAALSNTGPGTAWATNDGIGWTMTYEAA